jgi:hypothetical protein
MDMLYIKFGRIPLGGMVTISKRNKKQTNKQITRRTDDGRVEPQMHANENKSLQLLSCSGTKIKGECKKGINDQ